MLTPSIALQRFEAVPRRDSEVLESARDLQLPELSPSHRLDTGKPSHPEPSRESFGVRVPEGQDHVTIITPRVMLREAPGQRRLLR